MRIIIADDHPLYLEAARQQVQRVFRKATVNVAMTLSELLDHINTAPADLVMMDFSMPGCDGIVTVREIVSLANSSPVVVISGVANEEDVAACIQVGVKGFLPKTLGGEIFATAIMLVAKGGTYVPIEFMTSQSRPGSRDPAPAAGMEGINEREKSMIKMVVAGASNKEIAREFSLQEVTVKVCLSRIFRKMGVKNRSHAAALAVRSGLVRDE